MERDRGWSGVGAERGCSCPGVGRSLDQEAGGRTAPPTSFAAAVLGVRCTAGGPYEPT